MPSLSAFSAGVDGAVLGEDPVRVVVVDHLVELPEIDPVGLEAAEAVLQVGLRVLGGAAADLGHEEDLVAEPALGQGFAHPLLGAAIVVVPGVVQEGDPLSDGPLDQPEAVRLRHLVEIGGGITAQAEEADHLAGPAQGTQRNTPGVGAPGCCASAVALSPATASPAAVVWRNSRRFGL